MMSFEELQQVIPVEERKAIEMQAVAETFPNLPKELNKDGQ